MYIFLNKFIHSMHKETHMQMYIQYMYIRRFSLQIYYQNHWNISEDKK